MNAHARIPAVGTEAYEKFRVSLSEVAAARTQAEQDEWHRQNVERLRDIAKLVRSAWHVIREETCAKHGVTVKEVMSSRRLRRISWCRQEIMYRLRLDLNLSYPEIGRRLGGYDHTTARHAFLAHSERNRADAHVDAWRRSTDV